MTYFIHVNRNTIAGVRQARRKRPCRPVPERPQRDARPTATSWRSRAPSRVISSSHEPLLPCGARLVITTEQQPIVVR